VRVSTSQAWDAHALDPVVEAWVATAMTELSTADFAQIDIDGLFDPAPPLAIRVTLDCLKTAVRLGRMSAPDLDGIAVIPLECSETAIALETPSWDQALDREWEYGPGRQVPGLYLVRPAIWRHQAAAEEYRHPIDVEGFLGPGFVGHYRCWRSSQDAERGWEYNREFFIRTTL
jgi:hypothetical protein